MVSYQHAKNICLDGTWELKGFDYDTSDYNRMQKEGEWLKCKVPGDIHNALIDSGIINNPLLADNFEKYLWTEEKEWWYKKQFIFKGGSDKKYELFFEGLDLNADIYLNEILIGHHTNAFIPFKADVTNYLAEGGNTIYVKIDCGLNSLSSFEKIEKYDHGIPLKYDQDFRRIFLRKPQYCFRWDWGQRLLTCGIWRGVELREIDNTSIENIYVYDNFLSGGEVELCIEVELNSDNNEELTFDVNIFDGEDTVNAKFSSEELVTTNQNIITFRKKIANPKLWWPNGYGEQNLYEINFKVLKNAICLSSANVLHGIRRVELIEEFITDDEGKSFIIAINGEKIFCKGANWIPADALPANVTRSSYENLIKKAADANFNMLRIWGGGIYEDKVFFEICARYGIMVWHDFIFANAYYPDDNEGFVEELNREFTYIFKEYRNFSSIVLWCGNNEINWTHQYPLGTVDKFYGKNIYETILPSFYEKYDGKRIYRVSSPYGDAGTGNHNSHLEGDSHSWGFWLSEDNDVASNYKQFYDEKSKFCCEYGVMSYPNLESVENYIGSKDLDVNSQVWKYHENFYENGNIDRILNRYYVDTVKLSVPKLIDYSQYMQGDIYRKSIEHFRRRKFTCSGVVFWMYNDCWGTGGWTIVDYYHREKASYKMVSQAYSPVLLSCMVQADKLSFYAINDTLNTYQACLVEIQIKGFDGEVKHAYKNHIDLERNEKIMFYEMETIKLEANNSYIFMKITDSCGESLYENVDFICDYKELNLPDTRLSCEIDNNIVKISASSLALNVRLSGENGTWFSDNYFNLQTGETKKVEIHGDSNIKVSCLNS